MDTINNLRNSGVSSGSTQRSSGSWTLEKAQEARGSSKKIYFERQTEGLKGIEKPVQLRLPLYFSVN